MKIEYFTPFNIAPIDVEEFKNKDFSKKISQIYRRLAKKHRWKIVNASGTKQEVHKEILKIIFKKIGS